MNEFQVFFSLSVLFLIILITFIYMIRNVSMKRIFLVMFLLGALGWTGAYFLRLFPLSLFQVFSLVTLGADFTSQEGILKFAYHPLVNIWGPIFAAIFEETIRYICVSRYIPVRSDRIKGPFFIGLGWTTGEIIMVYALPLMGTLASTTTIGLEQYIPGILERIIASILHIGLTFVVLYAIWETRPKISLLIAMLWHFLFNILAVIFMAVFKEELFSNLAIIWILELLLGLASITLIIFVWKYWIPKKEIEYDLPVL